MVRVLIGIRILNLIFVVTRTVQCGWNRNADSLSHFPASSLQVFLYRTRCAFAFRICVSLEDNKLEHSGTSFCCCGFCFFVVFFLHLALASSVKVSDGAGVELIYKERNKKVLKTICLPTTCNIYIEQFELYQSCMWIDSTDKINCCLCYLKLISISIPLLILKSFSSNTGTQRFHSSRDKWSLVKLDSNSVVDTRKKNIDIFSTFRRIVTLSVSIPFSVGSMQYRIRQLIRGNFRRRRRLSRAFLAALFGRYSRWRFSLPFRSAL